VVFLSMVYSPTGNGPLRLVADPGERIKKRFNVAASRARDQLWVVHSVDPENDLQHEDIRRRLIVHSRDPKAVEVSLEHLQLQTESEFEREVLQRLLSEGYKVTPQWRVGPYRIDLVVEDGTRRLAVECDGDRHHPPDKLREDMARQAILERMGWRFVRIRGSKFFRDPDGAMEPVLTRLKSLGVRPVGRASAEEQHPDSPGEELKDRVIRRADEIRREWDGGGDELVWAARRRQGGPTTGGSPHEKAPAQQQPSPQGSPSPGHKAGAARGSAQQESGSPTSALSGQGTSPPEPKSGQALRGSQSSDPDTRPVRPKRPLVAGAHQSKPSSLPSAAIRPNEKRDRSSSRDDDGFDVVEFLRLRKLEVIDKRPAGGALWVVGGSELSELLGGLKARGYAFHFAKNGGRASKNRPAWFAK
jgi:very-short-patch-repair endonuclease